MGYCSSRDKRAGDRPGGQRPGDSERLPSTERIGEIEKKTRKNDAPGHETPESSGAERGLTLVRLVPIILAMTGSMGEQRQR